MHRTVILVSCVASLALVGCSGGSQTSNTSTAHQESETHFTQISVEAVAAALAAPEHRVAVYDANHRETYDEHHVPGATWVDYDGVTREQLPTDTSTPLVFYCHNEQCSASHVAAESAVAMGFSDVSVMGAGITGWVAAGQPVETAAPDATATQ